MLPLITFRRGHVRRSQYSRPRSTTLPLTMYKGPGGLIARLAQLPPPCALPITERTVALEQLERRVIERVLRRTNPGSEASLLSKWISEAARGLPTDPGSDATLLLPRQDRARLRPAVAALQTCKRILSLLSDEQLAAQRQVPRMVEEPSEHEDYTQHYVGDGASYAVMVYDGNDGRTLRNALSPDVRSFDWGASSNGAVSLAMSILADALNDGGTRQSRGWSNFHRDSSAACSALGPASAVTSQLAVAKPWVLSRFDITVWHRARSEGYSKGADMMAVEMLAKAGRITCLRTDPTKVRSHYNLDWYDLSRGSLRE
jgi:hypothetical protein